MKKKKDKKTILLNFKVNKSELKKIKKNAKEFNNGKVSGFVRHAAMNYFHE